MNVLVGEENAYKATCADQASKTSVTVLAILDPSENFTLGIKRGINSITLHPLLVSVLSISRRPTKSVGYFAQRSRLLFPLIFGN